MSASLVGSEMCIRDSRNTLQTAASRLAEILGVDGTSILVHRSGKALLMQRDDGATELPWLARVNPQTGPWE
eukprot:2693381-Alexandrium_andersonii.AAC.1